MHTHPHNTSHTVMHVHMVVVVIYFVASSFLHLSGWAPFFSTCSNDVCCKSLIFANVCYVVTLLNFLKTGNTLNITASEYAFPQHCDACDCSCYNYVTGFSFLPQLVSLTPFHIRQWFVQYQWSLLMTAMFSLLFTFWECMERIS